MGFVGDMFNSSKGAGFGAEGANPEQLNTAYGQTQSGIAQQQNFINAIAGQNGLGNQASVFNQQQGLANQLQGVANGTGPNPALAQLNQTTGQNVANQAALMAGQRGSNANTGLIARQAAQQGGALQQQAAGQGATLQAQQQLAAMQQLQNQQASMGNLANTQVNQQQAGLSALNDQSLRQQQNLLGMQANINNANANIAGANQGAQSNMLGNVMGGAGSAMQMFGGKSGGGGAAGSIASTPGMDMAGGAGDAAGGVGDMAGAGEMLAAHGGYVKKMAIGGDVSADPLMQPVQNQEVAMQSPAAAPSGPQSNAGRAMAIDPGTPRSAGKGGGGGGGNPLGGMGGLANTAMSGLMKWGEKEALPYIGDFFSGLGSTAGGMTSSVGADMAGGAGDVVGGGGAALGSAEAGTAAAGIGEGAVMVAAQGGKVPALLSPGERYLSPNKVEAVKEGKASPIKDGKKVPGKPKVAGAKDDYANDTVKAHLDAGGIVIPRSITQSKNPEEKAMAFVRAVLAKQSGKLPKKA